MTSLTMWLLFGMFVAVTCETLRDLYNSCVHTAEWMDRPKGKSRTGKSYVNTHSGVRVTLEDGRQFLIHKGLNFGKSSDTVVTDATMSKRWREPKETRDFRGSRTVGDFVKVGGKRYNPLGFIRGNCHAAARNMMRQKVEGSGRK